jgi:DNA polymerase-3 subunit epsilon
MTKGRAGAFTGPGNLPEDKLRQLPESIGVYLFYDAAGKVIYAGKAINLKERVHQHFGSQTHTREKRQFLESVYDLSYMECGHELMALMTENDLIKKHYPRFNRLNKDFRLNFGIYEFEDQRGYRRLMVGESGKWTRPLRVFRSRDEAVQLLLKLTMENGLCLKLNGLTADRSPACGYESGDSICLACSGEESAIYNQRVQALIDLQFRSGKILLIMKGRKEEECGAVFQENGKILGYGYLQKEMANSGSFSQISECLLPYYDTRDAQSILRPWLEMSRQLSADSDGILIFEVPEQLNPDEENTFSEGNSGII